MAAIVPSSVQNINMGSKNMLVARFTTCADGDTWASTIPAITTKWIDMNGNPTTQASAGFASTFSAGTFTFYPGENSLAFVLHVVF